MGLWDWFIGSFLGQPRADAPHEPGSDARAAGTPRAAGTARAASTGSSAGGMRTSTATGSSVATVDDPGDEQPEERDEPQTPPGTEPEERPWWAPEGATAVDFVPPPRPDLSANARGIENMLISQFDGHDLSMPSLPQSAERVLSNLGRKDSDFGKVAAEIASDQVLAAAVLRAVNSPFYRGIEKITSLRPAVTRLGTKALRALIMHQAMRTATFMQKGGDNALASFVWRRSVVCGIVMRGLAKFCGRDEESAFLTGLLHDIGNVITLRVVCDEEKRSREKLNLPTFEYLCFESHQEFGELVAKEWKLPAELTSLIADHHTPPEPDDPLRLDRLMLQATDMITAMIGTGSMTTPYNLREARPVKELGLFQRQGIIAFLDNLPADIEEATDFF